MHVGHAVTPPAAVESLRPAIRVVAEQAARNGGAERAIELRIGYHELVLIHKALEVVKTLEWLPRQDELLNDTLCLVDLALNDAV